MRCGEFDVLLFFCTFSLAGRLEFLGKSGDIEEICPVTAFDLAGGGVSRMKRAKTEEEAFREAVGEAIDPA